MFTPIHLVITEDCIHHPRMPLGPSKTFTQNVYT